MCDQRSGSDLLASCTRSATLIVDAPSADSAPVARVPSSSSMYAQSGSVLIAEWMATKPPPCWK